MAKKYVTWSITQFTAKLIVRFECLFDLFFRVGPRLKKRCIESGCGGIALIEALGVFNIVTSLTNFYSASISIIFYGQKILKLTIQI